MARNNIHDTLIVGADPGGIGAAAELRAAGVEDLVVLETGDRVVGSWRDNPGDLADSSGLGPRIRFGVTVTGLTFDETAGVWTAAAGRRRFRARTVVLAPDVLCDHTIPDIRGGDTYRGPTMHSARWDHAYDVTGKRVGVIGTGTGAVRLVPDLITRAEFVKVFQRTPAWVLPRVDVTVPAVARTALGTVPAAALVWLAKAHLRRQVDDAWLRRQLTPDVPPARGRIALSSDYYPALQADNCKLIDWPIATMSPVGLRTSDGLEHHLDCIVFATDEVHRTGPPFPVTGLSGRSLPQGRAGDAPAYRDATIHGYPNLFLVAGPRQIGYTVAAITTILRGRWCYLDVRADTLRGYRRPMSDFRIDDYHAVAGDRPVTGAPV